MQIFVFHSHKNFRHKLSSLSFKIKKLHWRINPLSSISASNPSATSPHIAFHINWFSFYLPCHCPLSHRAYHIQAGESSISWPRRRLRKGLLMDWRDGSWCSRPWRQTKFTHQSNASIIVTFKKADFKRGKRRTASEKTITKQKHMKILRLARSEICQKEIAAWHPY